MGQSLHCCSGWSQPRFQHSECCPHRLNGQRWRAREKLVKILNLTMG